MLAALALVAATLLSPLAGTAGASGPPQGLITEITGVSSNFYWFNGDPQTDGGGQWVGYAHFKNDWIRHQYLDLKVTKVHTNGSTTVENVNSFYVPLNGTSSFAVWNNDLTVSGGVPSGIIEVIVTVKKVTSSDVNWIPYSGNVTGPTTTIPSPLGGGSSTSTTTTTTTSTTAPGPDCGDYTPTQLAVSPVMAAPGGAIVLTGIASPGDTVDATIEASPGNHVALGSAVADGSGNFQINANIPPNLSTGTYTITVTSTTCPSSTTVSIGVAAPSFSGCGYNNAARTFFPGQTVTWELHSPSFSTSQPVKLVLNKKQGSSFSAVLYDGPWPASGDVTFTVPVNAPSSDKYVIDQIGRSTSGHHHHHGGKGHHDKGKAISKSCAVKVLGATPTPPQHSSCRADHAARIFFPGQRITWTLHRDSFDTSKPVKLVLERSGKKSQGYSVTVYDGRWPSSGEVSFTVPVGAPISDKYVVDQIGTSKRGHQHHHKSGANGHDKGKELSKSCPVKVRQAPTPIASLGSESDVAGVPVPGAALLIGAVSLMTLLRLRLRRRWA